MLTISLFRHAKTEQAEPGGNDFDRVLTRRGQKDAAALGAYFAVENICPDLVLCSTSKRTRQTLTAAFAGLPEPPVLFEEQLYHASAPTMLNRLREVDADKTHVMIIGHNPGTQALAMMLSKTGDVADRAGIAQKFPTAALAIISFEVNAWRAIRAGGGHLQRFVTPRQLRGKD